MKLAIIFAIVLSGLVGCATESGGRGPTTTVPVGQSVLIPATYELPSGQSFVSGSPIYYVQITRVDGESLQGAEDAVESPVYIEPGDHRITARIIEFRAGLIPALTAYANAEKTAETFAISTKPDQCYVVKATIAEFHKLFGIRSPKSYQFYLEECTDLDIPRLRFDY